MAGPWQTSIILRLMGRQLGYRTLQTKLVGIWRPTGKPLLIDIGYGFFIMHFDILTNYQHALMDGPWFVGNQYLHVQAWAANFHPHVAKISNTAVWIHLKQLPIEYYHPEFLKHVGNKLEKLLKIDVVTSVASRGRFAKLCVQFNIAYPLSKRVKIRAFWQDIVYENLPILCFRYGRLGHREVTCPEPSHAMPHTHPSDQEPHGETEMPDLENNHTPWKTVQTRRSNHGFKNRTGHRTVFLKISGSTPVFDRFLAGFPVVDRLLTGFEAFNRTGLAPGSRLNRSDRPVRSGF